MFLHAFWILQLLVLLSSFAFAQEESKPIGSVGAFIGGGLNIHSANFQTLPGVPSCCPRFESGIGFGLCGGVSYQLPLSQSFNLQCRVGYSSLSATLKKNEATTVIVDDSHRPGVFQHTVSASLGMISLSTLVGYDLLDNLILLGGPTIGWIPTNTYSEKETIVDPVNIGTFENGFRVRNQYSGATPNAAKIYLAATVGVQYVLPLDRKGVLHLLPQLSYTFGLTPIVSGMKWRINSFQAGIGVRYDILKTVTPPPAPEIVVPPPPVVIPVEEKPKPPVLAATLEIVVLDSDEVEKPIKELVIEDYIRTQYRPLLNYVFFDEASSMIPQRYDNLRPEETKTFTTSKLNELETLPLYYELLNIVGERLQQYPKARLTIVGCNDSHTNETKDKELPRKRAKTVADYLTSTWGIELSRIRIEARSLPEKPSSVSDSDGSQENRRVELYSTDFHILEPIFTIDTAHIPKPPIVRFLPIVTSEAGIRNWELTSIDNERKLKDFSGKDSLPRQINWELEKERESLLSKMDTVHSALQVSDRVAQTTESPTIAIPVRHYTLADKHREGSIDTIISRYSLILFDYDSGELSEANRRIANFVKERISDEARVSIFGYTDRIGTDDYNQQLSALRAKATQQYIGINRADVKGLGRTKLLYDNSLPEGRFYSRTVTVVVTTPTKR